MALEAGGLAGQMVTAAADGEMKLIDFRMLGEGATAGAPPPSCCSTWGRFRGWRHCRGAPTKMRGGVLRAEQIGRRVCLAAMHLLSQKRNNAMHPP